MENFFDHSDLVDTRFVKWAAYHYQVTGGRSSEVYTQLDVHRCTDSDLARFAPVELKSSKRLKHLHQKFYCI